MKDNLKKIIEHENANWSKIFQIELGKNSDKKFSSFWWESYYNDLKFKGVNSESLPTCLGLAIKTFRRNGGIEKTKEYKREITLATYPHVCALYQRNSTILWLFNK